MTEEDQPKTNRRGRPPGSTSPDAKTGQVRLRVDLAEKGRWVRAARKQGASLSQWLRRLANEHS